MNLNHNYLTNQKLLKSKESYHINKKKLSKQLKDHKNHNTKKVSYHQMKEL
jgi:hypothetical protein